MSFSVFSLFLFPLCPALVFPAEPEEKQKEILNNTIPEGKDSGDLLVSTLLSACFPFCCVAVGVLFMYIKRCMSCYYTMVTLGCLWSSVKYVGGYHGLLSGVTIRPGSVEPHSVVECLYACREGLDFGDLETLGSGMKVTPQRIVLHHILELHTDTERHTFPSEMKMYIRNIHYVDFLVTFVKLYSI